jgi:hypothetical protein
MRINEIISEAFDKPYKILRWEKGDYGDVDAIARLDDNTFLSIMFNKGFSQGTKEEAWSVEFFRNNSQEVTGEGDAQRVFATVISAIQTFIKKYKPNKIIFSASKEVEQGQNSESRARLYDSLVQRYARSWGFRAFRADTGNKVIYELSRIKPVNEDSGNSLQTIIQSFVNSPIGQKYKQHDCKTVTRAFVQWAEQNKIPTQVVSLAPPSADFIAKNPQFKGKSGEGDGHIMPIVNGSAIDFTVRQFGVNRPFNNPLVTPTNSLPAVYGKFGYFTDKPEWFLGGKSHWIGALNAIPPAIFNQNFGDEMLEHTMAEDREKFNQEVMRPGFRWSEEISGITYLVRTQWDNMPEVIARVNNREIGRATFINHHTRSGLESVSTYVSPKWQGHGIAKNMYAVMRMLGANIQPSATQTAMGKDMWAKWKKSGDTKHLTSMNAKPEQQDMAENFADGKVKGKSRPGRVKRSGASCDGSVTDLRSKAKNASGERAKMYHWCANMKSSRK